jgi:hypothetical protein
MLWTISAGLNFIHERDLVHGHGGNILVENEMDSIDTKIADTGLLINKYLLNKFTELYTLTKESDIYSFGMIMWMLSAGKNRQKILT